MWISIIISSELSRTVGALARRTSLIAFAVTLAGCATLGDEEAGDGASPSEKATVARAPVPMLVPVPVPQSAGQLQLAQGLALYDSGDYAAAIRKLQSAREIWTDAPQVQISAHKHIAFSQCLLNRRQLCRQAFDAVLKLDPAFELTASEHGHPSWGPVFSAARHEASRPRPARAAEAPAEDRRTVR